MRGWVLLAVPPLIATPSVRRGAPWPHTLGSPDRPKAP